jgi:transposase-like protein
MNLSGNDHIDLFKRCHFDSTLIILCVRWYLTYKLSYRDLVAIMAERNVDVAPTTILRWVQRYVPEFEQRWQRYTRAVGTRGASMKPI